MSVGNFANPIRRTGTGDGASAYDIAVINGFRGTEQEWLASLIGPAGTDGRDGIDGKDGADGTDGFSPSIEVVKTETGYHLTITTIDGTQSFDLLDGLDGQDGRDGTDGRDGRDGTDGRDGVDGKDGEKGDKGDPGTPFAISKIYPSIAAMEADYDNADVEIGQFVIVNTGDVEDDDNAKLYLKTESGFSFVVDLSGATGIQGPPGVSPTIAVTETEDGHEVNVTDVNGTQSFEVINGQPGQDGASAYDVAVANGFDGTEQEWLASLSGESGQNGTSPTVAISEITGGHRVTITDVNGVQTFDVMDGAGGMSDFPTIRDTAINNISFLDKSVNNDLSFTIPCCIRLINSSLGYTFEDDIVHVYRDYDGKLIVTTIDNATVIFNVDESTGGLELAMSDRLGIRLSLIEEDIESLKEAVENGDGGSIEVDATLTKSDDGIVSVTSPVRSIISRESFEALPEEERNKGLYVVYDETDNVGDLPNVSVSGSGEVYSTEEKVIGTWIDDRPLYRRTWEFTSDTPTNEATNGLVIDSAIEPRRMCGAMTLSDGCTIQLGTASPETLTSTVAFAYINSSKRFQVWGGSVIGPKMVGMPCWITAEYTKSSDLSDFDSPSAYSTEESCIGTWIDGELLYQKVVQFTLASPTVDTKVVELGTDVSIKRIDGYIHRSTSDVYYSAPYQSPKDNSHTIGIYYNGSDRGLYVHCGSDLSSVLKNAPGWAILEYTKA